MYQIKEAFDETANKYTLLKCDQRTFMNLLISLNFAREIEQNQFLECLQNRKKICRDALWQVTNVIGLALQWSIWITHGKQCNGHMEQICIVASGNRLFSYLYSQTNDGIIKKTA